MERTTLNPTLHRTTQSTPQESAQSLNTAQLGTADEDSFKHSSRDSRPQTKPHAASATACGKCILIGEHAVVYGSQAIAMPLINLSTRVQLKPLAPMGLGEDGRIVVQLGQKSPSEQVYQTVFQAFELLNVPRFSAKLQVQSKSLIGAGMGSSAALAVVVLKVIAASVGQQLSAKTLAQMANELEKRFHGNPSGLDTAVVSYMQTIAFRRGHTPRVIKTASGSKTSQNASQKASTGGGPQSFRFALIDTRVRSSTLSMIRIAQPYFSGRQGDLHVQAFEELAIQAERALTEHQHDVLKEVINTSAAYLSEAGVVDRTMIHIKEQCEQLGLPAIKPTGAGGGGCMLALLAEDAHTSARQYQQLIEVFGPERVYSVQTQL